MVALLDGDPRRHASYRALLIDDGDVDGFEESEALQPAPTFLDRGDLEPLPRQVRKAPPDDRVPNADVSGDIDRTEYRLQAWLGPELDTHPIRSEHRLQRLDARIRVAGISQGVQGQSCGLLHVGECDRLSRLRGAASLTASNRSLGRTVKPVNTTSAARTGSPSSTTSRTATSFAPRRLTMPSAWA